MRKDSFIISTTPVEVVGKHKIEKLSIEKIKTIFEDGKFIGPYIRDEIEEEY